MFLEHSFRSTDPAYIFQSEFPRHDLTFGKQVGTSTWNSHGKLQICWFSCYWDMTRYPVTSWISIFWLFPMSPSNWGRGRVPGRAKRCWVAETCCRRCTQAEGCGCCGCFSVQASAFVPLEPITGEIEMRGKDGCNSEISDVRCSDFHNFMMGYTKLCTYTTSP